MELTLDLSLDFLPKTVPDFLHELSSISDSFTRHSKLDDYVKRLEDEMRKIDAFKRELPLCVLLLQDAILRLKEDHPPPVIEEFIPLKPSSDQETENVKNNKNIKNNWLWNADFNLDDKIPNPKSNLTLNGDEDDRSVPQTPIEHWDSAKRRRAFELFKDQNNFVKIATKEDGVFSEVPKLTLMTPISDPFPVNLTVKSGGGGGGGGRAAVSALCSPAAQMKGQTKLSQQQQQSIRKQRRCWSPELHRRFVDALHRLGGSQVATPKQIRELMQVDGLTNDEVKSHLQKYRLHVRKLAPPESSGGEEGWTAEEHSGEQHHSKRSATHAGSPDGPLHHGGGSGKALSMTEGESMEGEEDDGQSWKGNGIILQKHGD